MRFCNRPVSWWGWHGWGYEPRPMSILEILEAGTMPPRLAALLWMGMERGASVVVAAEPSLAGKSTILTALLSLTPQDSLGYFTRGIGEPFALPPKDGGQPLYLLINEMSDHLPVYTWGPYARRAFELLAQGCYLLTTMHADSVAEVIATLEQELGVPRRQIGRLTFILSLRLFQRSGRLHRRVAEAALLQPQGEELSLHPLAAWSALEDSFLDLADGEEEALARWAGLSPAQLREEISRREAYLAELLGQGVREMMAVEEAVARYR